MSTAKAMARLLRAEKALGTAVQEVAAARTELLKGPEPARNREALQRLGAWLRAYREAQGLSRAELARLVGLSKGSAKNLELGKHFPTRATVSLLRGLPVPADLLAELMPQG